MTEHGVVASPPAPPARDPKVRAPSRTADTHFHIFESAERYPLSPQRMYNPALSTVEDYRRMAETIGIERMVVVQASVYGTDNRCLLDSIRRLGTKNTRGIAVVDQSVTMEQLRDMDASGVCGIRFNAITGRAPIEWLPSLAKMIEPLGWHIQLWINSERFLQIGSILDDVPVPIVLDHMGQFPAPEGVKGEHFQHILQSMKDDRFWIKLVGYRVSQLSAPFEDIREAAVALVSAAPQRCLWGTDWPHIFLEGRPMPNTTDLFETMNSWFPSTDLERIFVENPARLYRFG